MTPLEEELNAARKAKRDEALLEQWLNGADEHLRGRVNVRSVLGITNASNSLVFRFFCYIAEEEEKKYASSTMAKCVKVACRGVKATPLTIYNAEKALEVRGIGPHLANLLERSLFHLYPQEVPREETERNLRERSENEANKKKGQKKKTASAATTSQKRPKKKKAAYRPKNGTANYAFLVCMHKLMLEGQDFVLKQDLIRMAESSGLAAKSIHGTMNQSNAQNRNANWYNGWSSFTQMKKRDPPLVETWSCPMKCKLTREGELLAQDLHWNAHERQMCSCSFVRGFNEGGGENNNNDNDDDKGNGASTSGVARRGVAAGLAKPKPSLMANLDDEVEVEVEDDDVVVGTQCSQLAMMSQKPVGVFPSSGEMQQPPSQQVLPQILENNTQQTEGSGAAEEEEDPYESHLRTSSDLSLPPLEENEKFSDAYDVILQMDNREQLRRNADSSGKQGSRAQNLEMYTSALTESGLKVEIGHLAVGDVTWVARRKKMKQTASSSSFATGDRETYVLDYVIERKSVDDLVESMKSNRYGIQKLLLHKSGLSNVLYLVEGDIDAHNNAQMAKNALVKMQVKDGFTVVRTGGINGTLQLYKNLTRLIEKQYSSMTGPTSASSQQCLTLKGLEELASRERKLTISDIFKLQLQHIPGIGKQAAEAIVKAFATPMVFWKGAVVGEDGNPDVKKAVDALKGISLSHGVRKSTLGQIKAKKIMGFLLNSEV